MHAGKRECCSEAFPDQKPLYFYAYGKFPAYYNRLAFLIFKKCWYKYIDAHKKERLGFSLVARVCVRCSL